jgi:AmiR/NasT family two-component response regulator
VCACSSVTAFAPLPVVIAMRVAVLSAALAAAVAFVQRLQRVAAASDRAAARLVEVEGDLERARRELEERKLVERAKGALMTALNIDEQRAFRTLQKAARDRNLRLAEVARRVVDQIS